MAEKPFSMDGKRENTPKLPTVHKGRRQQPTCLNMYLQLQNLSKKQAVVFIILLPSYQWHIMNYLYYIAVFCGSLVPLWYQQIL